MDPRPTDGENIEFFGVAMALENTGVTAYKRVAPTVSNESDSPAGGHPE